MKEFEIKIPPFEGYDKTPRWEMLGKLAVAFEDGATFAFVNHEDSLGWYTLILCTADNGEDEYAYHFTTAEDAIAHVNQVYLALQARIAEYLDELELDIDEELLKEMEGMEADEVLAFLELSDEDEEI